MSIFSSVPIFVPKTNKIDLSHQSLMTTSLGKATPCLVEECLPGDVFKVRTELFCRFQPLMAPIMDRCDISIHYFFYPTRLAFENFYKFLCDEEIEPGVNAVVPFAYLDDIVLATFDAMYPTLASGTYKINRSLMDYLNLPTDQFTVTVTKPSALWEITTDAPHIPVNMVPFIAYFRIWEKYYRDENLTDFTEWDSVLSQLRIYGGNVKDYNLSVGTGNLLNELVKLRLRAYKKDYFTSALPWPQKGSEALLPVGSQEVQFYHPDGHVTTSIDPVYSNPEGEYRVKLESSDGTTTEPITAKTTGVSSASINDLRTAMRVQQLLENNARGGTRQQEFIKAHWGVYAKDARINDPEYVGGSTTPIQISEVLSQVATQSPGTRDNNLGQLGGRGISAGFGSTKKYRVTEHGYLMAIVSILPKASYFQGIPRMFSHLERYQYFFPELSHLGEQEILNKELVCEPVQENGADMEGTFGYTPRYAEYKYHANEIHGDFRDTLNYWHTARIFENTPGLNESFVTVDSANQGQNRIFSYINNDYDQILLQIYHHNPMLRKMPYFGIPKF